MASTEDESAVPKIELEVPKVENTAVPTSGSENFVVLDMAGDSEDSDKEGNEGKEKAVKPSSTPNETVKAPATTNVKPVPANPRLRKKPKAPVVDVNSLRKRKWQLKVYPLHADDLQINYVSILCKLASESLLYIPSESRHGKAELYVATQKETAAIIGKLLRMGFHHKHLSIEVVRKDTGGKEDGEESKKECKAFLMFDKFLSKKIFDAKGEKGTTIEKIVTLNKLPKAATKDFIGVLFPFATEIDIIESDNPDERKAVVKCKTPVTSLLVYKSFKRLEINDVHVKLSVDDSVKAIVLPPVFFIPPPDKKDLGPPESLASLNQSSLPARRPQLTSLTRRAQQIKKRALLTRKRPTRGQVMRNQRTKAMEEEMMEDGPRGMDPRGMPRRSADGRWSQEAARDRGPGSRDYQGGPGRRRFNDRGGDRRNRDRDSMDRGRPRSQDSQMTKEMLQLQNQLNQAIKNQIAMLSTSQPRGGMRGGMQGDRDAFPGPAAQRAPLLGQGPRHFGPSNSLSGPSTRGLEPEPMKESLLGQGPRHFGSASVGNSSRKRDHMGKNVQDFPGSSSWPSERPGRVERGERQDRERGDRGDRVSRNDRQERSSRQDRNMERGQRIDRSGGRMDGRIERIERDRERGERSDRYSAGSGDLSHQQRSRQSQPYGGEGVHAKPERSHGGSAPLNSGHASDSGRNSSRRTDYNSTSRSQRHESYSGGQASSSSGRYTEYSQVEGESSSYYRSNRV